MVRFGSLLNARAKIPCHYGELSIVRRGVSRHSHNRKRRNDSLPFLEDGRRDVTVGTGRTAAPDASGSGEQFAMGAR